MSKPKSVAVNRPDGSNNAHDIDDNPFPNAPLSGSKKVKNANHVSHRNPQG